MEQNKDFNDLNISNKVRYALQAYNQTIHSVTKRTPNEIVFGNYNEIKEEISPETVIDNYVQSHKEIMKKIYDETKLLLDNSKKNTLRHKLIVLNYLIKHSKNKLKETLVKLRNLVTKNNKLKRT